MAGARVAGRKPLVLSSTVIVPWVPVSSGRLRQVKIYLTAEQYERLRRIAEQQGVTPSRIVKMAVLELLGEDGEGRLAARLRYLEARYEQLAREVGRIERDLLELKRRCRGK